jgi:hypothetical protein
MALAISWMSADDVDDSWWTGWLRGLAEFAGHAAWADTWARSIRRTAGTPAE